MARRPAASLESGSVGLEDRDALRVLRDAFEGDPGSKNTSNELVHRFYTHWFALDASVRDLFPPEMDSQRAVSIRMGTTGFLFTGTLVGKM